MAEDVEQGTGGELTKDARMWGMICHLAGLAMLIGIPLANVLGPLIVWLIKKDEHPFIDEQGKEALNFQITMAICLVVSLVLTVILIGFLLLLVVGIVDIIFTIIAAMKANEGVSYRYPLTIRLIK
jgi:uncharacterized protein